MMAGLRLIQLATAVLSILLVILFVMANTNFCGSVFETQVDHALTVHGMETFVAVDEFECQLKCIANNSCKSFNVHPSGNKSKVVCELNNKTRQMKPGHFKWKKGSTYYGSVQVSCIGGSDSKNLPQNSGHCHPGYEVERCHTHEKGLYSNRPARSCKDILDSGQSKGDGEYWIDPEENGNPFKVYCDMTTDGGGWLMISNVVIEGSSPSAILGFETYRGISNYNNNNMALATSVLNELRTYSSFTQLRFHCYKRQPGRTFHVTTAPNSTGEAVVQYFSRQTDAMPYACGSFARLEGDNSYLARDCAIWGKDNGVYKVGKWGHQGMRELYEFPAFIFVLSHWVTSPSNRWECDDYQPDASPGDFWKIYVR